MTTHTFFTILAWPLAIYTGIIVAVNFTTYLKLAVNARGFGVLCVLVLCLWWLLCN